MRVAVIGSRTLSIRDLGSYLPPETTEIVSGGARGVDRSARAWALAAGKTLTEFLPEYKKYGRFAPLKRNMLLLDYAELVLIFWDGRSRGTKFSLDYCREKNIPLQLYLVGEDGQVKLAD